MRIVDAQIQIYDAFGPARMPCSWRQCVTMFSEELPWLPEGDKPLVMGRAVCAWWNWTNSSRTMEDRE